MSGTEPVLRVCSPASATRIDQMCDELRVLIAQTDYGPVPCDVDALRPPDLTAIEALARLQLTARRLNRSICLINASRDLVDLLEFAGLADLCPSRRKVE